MYNNPSRIRRKKGSEVSGKSESSPEETSWKDKEPKISPGLLEIKTLSPHYFSQSGLLGEIVNKLPLGIMGRNMTGGGRYVFWNNFMENLTGVEGKKILHYHGDDVLPLHLREIIQEQDIRVVQEERALDCGIVPFPGISARIHMIKALFRDAHTGHHLVVSILEDVSLLSSLEGRLCKSLQTVNDLGTSLESLQKNLAQSLHDFPEELAAKSDLQDALVAVEESLKVWHGFSRRDKMEAPAREKALPTVLLLEQDPTVRSFAVRTLEWEKWPFRQVENEEELARILREEVLEEPILLMSPSPKPLPDTLNRIVLFQDEVMSPETAEEHRKRGLQLCPKPFAAKELLESLRHAMAHVPKSSSREEYL